LAIIVILFPTICLLAQQYGYSAGRKFVAEQRPTNGKTIVDDDSAVERIDPLCQSPLTKSPPMPLDLSVALRRMLESNVRSSGVDWAPIIREFPSVHELERSMLARISSDVVASTQTFRHMVQHQNQRNETLRVVIHTWVDSNANTRILQVELIGVRGAETNNTISWPSSHWRTLFVLQLRRAAHRLWKYTGHDSIEMCVTLKQSSAPISWAEIFVLHEFRSKKCDEAAINVTVDARAGSCARNDHKFQSFDGSPVPPIAQMDDLEANLTTTSGHPILVEVALDNQQLRHRDQRSLLQSLLVSICALRNHSARSWMWDQSSSPPKVICGGGSAADANSEWPLLHDGRLELWSTVGSNRFHHVHQPEKHIATIYLVAPDITSRPWRVLDNDTPEHSLIPKSRDVVIYSLNIHTIVNVCSRCRKGACPQLIGFIPGPFVPHRERAAVERSIIECTVLVGCLPPSIMWLRPAEEEVQHPAMTGPAGYENATEFYNVTDAFDNPMQELKMIPLKDIQEFSVEIILVASILFSSWVTQMLHPVDHSHHILEGHIVRWSERTMYDPDWFYLPVPSAWALQSTISLVGGLVTLSTTTARAAYGMISNITNTSALVKKSAKADLVWSIVLPGAPESLSHECGYDRIDHHFQRLLDVEIMKQYTTNKPLSSAEKKKRKRVKVIGPNVSVRARFGWHTENTDAFSDLIALQQTSLVVLAAVNATVLAADAQQQHTWSKVTRGVRWATFFHYPWVRDNLYHLHNDNILPLLLAIRREEQLTRVSSRQSQTVDSKLVSCRRLILLPSTRKLQTPLTFALDLFRIAFDQVVELETQPGNGKDKPLRRVYRGLRPGSAKCNNWVSQLDTESSSMGLLLDGPIVFGRPSRPFSTEMRNVAPFAAHQIVPMWRELVWEFAGREIQTARRSSKVSNPSLEALRLFGNMDLLIPNAHHEGQTIFVTWLTRRGSRSLDTDGALLGWLAEANQTLASMYLCRNCVLRIQVCCDGLSFWEQVAVMKRTDILIGVHGAGLLHSIFLNPIPRRFASTASTFTTAITPLVVHVGSAHMNHHEQVVIQRLTTLASTNRSHRLRYHTTVTSPFPLKNRAASWRDHFHLSGAAIQDLLNHAIWLYFSSA
jgi:hypothetical protein